MAKIDSSAGRRLRVLQVVQRFSPELGGLETHVAEVTKRLAETDDIDVTILTTDRTGELPRDDRINGVRVLRRRAWRREGEEYFAPGLWRVIRRGRWDLIHVQGSQTTVPTLAMLAALRSRIPFVVTFHSGGHSSPSHGVITAVQSRINAPLLRRAAQLIAVSRFERSRFERITGLPRERFAVIGNGGALPPVPADVRPQPGTIVTSGRLEKYKGHHRVIRALPLVRRSIPDARVTVLGSGPYEPELRRLTAELGVDDAVSFRHLLPGQRAEMSRILAGSAVMAALSSYEAHPVAVMEAVALGLPVVGSDVAGVGDLVEDGLVVGMSPDADDAEVASVLTRELRLVDGGPRTPPDVELPTWESCTDQVAAIYRRILGRRALKVVQIITTLTTGGAERQVESLVTHSGDRQRVIALYGGGKVADSLRRSGTAVDVLNLGGIRRLFALPILFRRLRRLRPDAVQVHLLSGQLWGLPAAKLAGVPTIVSTEHSLMDDSIENRPLTPALRTLYLALSRLATRTVAVSSTTADRLVKWGIPRRRITVIDNGIDFGRLAFSRSARAEVRMELGISAGAEVVGAVGRLEPVKRFPQLLSAIAPTLERGRRELVIVGDGPLRSSLVEQAATLGVSDSVHVTGARSDVPALLSAMDVVVSPSRDETFGMAVLEAMGSGLPVVYAQCPALDELGVEIESAVRIDTRDDAHERDSIVAGIEAALRADTDRAVVPPEIIEAYDITSTSARVDRLMRELSTRSAVRSGRGAR